MDVDAVKLLKLTSEEKKKCIKEGLCFYYKKKGHMVSDYPRSTKPSKKPHVQWAQKEEKLPKLKKIADDEEDEGIA